MIFEWLIAYHRKGDYDILGMISDCLTRVLDDNLNEFDAYEVEQMIVPRTERVSSRCLDDEVKVCSRIIFCFALNLPGETASMRIVVDEFAEALNEPPVAHLIKFDDPLIQIELAKRVAEIYTLEMKLRRVLTLVYLHAYQDGDPYDLLGEETVQPMSKERPKSGDMKARAENQFFHLTFSQYIGLNRRSEFKLPDLLQLIRDKDAYDSFRDELSRAPVQDEDDAGFLAGLKERMNAVEAMRNCCAHNRRPSKKVEENFLNATPLLDQLLDDYLTRWELQEPESAWDAEARKAVESALKNANWDKDNRTITLYDPDDDRMREEVTSREELEQSLCEIACTEFYENAPRDEGEFVFDCEEDDIVWAVLEQYEEQLESFFDRNDPEED